MEPRGSSPGIHVSLQGQGAEHLKKTLAFALNVVRLCMYLSGVSPWLSPSSYRDPWASSQPRIPLRPLACLPRPQSLVCPLSCLPYLHFTCAQFFSKIKLDVRGYIHTSATVSMNCECGLEERDSL